MVTAFWLSSAVENTWLFLVGIVVLRSMMREHATQSRCRATAGDVSSADVALQHAGLDRRADGDDFVGLTPLCGSAEQLLHHFLNLRYCASCRRPAGSLRRFGGCQPSASFSALRHGSMVF
jgi:hypothetical protein